MEEFVARENIRRFEAQLAGCEDEDQRKVLLGLLEAEHKRLDEISAGQLDRKSA